MISKGDWYIHPNGTIKRAEYEVEKGSFIDLDCTLWQPKEGEWCWGWKQGVKGHTHVYPLLCRFKKLVNKETNTYKNGYKYESDVGFFTHMEPFIGELPSFLKENR